MGTGQADLALIYQVGDVKDVKGMAGQTGHAIPGRCLCGMRELSWQTL